MLSKLPIAMTLYTLILNANTWHEIQSHIHIRFVEQLKLIGNFLFTTFLLRFYISTSPWHTLIAQDFAKIIMAPHFTPKSNDIRRSTIMSFNIQTLLKYQE
jgi:hypothetical protein